MERTKDSKKKFTNSPSATINNVSKSLGIADVLDNQLNFFEGYYIMRTFF